MTGFFDSLYSQFLLRDLLAKVFPGFIVVFGIGTLVSSDPAWLAGFSSNFDTTILFGLIYGTSFVVGLIIQFAGERTGLIIIFVWPAADDNDNRQVSLRRAQEFLLHNRLTDPALRQRERFAILKELSGNLGASALILALAVLFSALSPAAPEPLSRLIALIILFAIAMCLLHLNEHHATEQLIWEQELLSRSQQTLPGAP